MKSKNLLFIIFASSIILTGYSQTKPNKVSVANKSIINSDLIGSQKLNSAIGTIELDNTFPTDETMKRIYEVRDIQRASEIVLWSLPTIQFQAWKEGQENAFGTNGPEFVVYTTLKENTGIVTSNATTPYIFGWPDLTKTGPIVIEMPAGNYASAIMDWWEYPVCDMGLTGPDKGNGGKYVIVGPNDNPEDFKDKGDFIFQSRTNKLSVGFRVLEPGDEAIKEFTDIVKVYPLKNDNHDTKFVFKADKDWYGQAPIGLKYFEMLHRAIQNEPVRDRDKAYMEWLHYFGIMDGEPFEPSENIKNILEEGGRLGELTARANAMEPYFAKPYYEGTNWYRLIDFPIEQEDSVRYYTDERAAWFYEAVTTTKGMKTETPGQGQVYLSTKRDSDGDFLKGGETYKLTIPANAPFEQFWSLTPYSEHTRGLIRSEITEFIDANRDSRDERLVFNDDGSVDLYFGPDDSKVPSEFHNNWMQTNIDEGWFPYFRLYAPKKEFFDKSWKLADIEKIK